jgi:hypothetical protein
MLLLSASLALKLVSMTGIVSPALGVPLTRVLRIHCVYEHASLFGFVLDTLLELAECTF